MSVAVMFSVLPVFSVAENFPTPFVSFELAGSTALGTRTGELHRSSASGDHVVRSNDGCSVRIAVPLRCEN